MLTFRSSHQLLRSLKVDVSVHILGDYHARGSVWFPDSLLYRLTTWPFVSLTTADCLAFSLLHSYVFVNIDLLGRFSFLYVRFAFDDDLGQFTHMRLCLVGENDRLLILHVYFLTMAECLLVLESGQCTSLTLVVFLFLSLAFYYYSFAMVNFLIVSLSCQNTSLTWSDCLFVHSNFFDWW